MNKPIKFSLKAVTQLEVMSHLPQSSLLTLLCHSTINKDLDENVEKRIKFADDIPLGANILKDR